MQRPDVFSYGDLAILRGLRMVYHHRKIDKKLFEKYRRRFSPYCSVASLYLWAVSGGAIPGMKDLSLIHICFGQDRSGKHVFCQKCDTGGIPVQPRDTTEGIGNPLRGIIPQHAICQRLFIMIHRRMNWHICRFVNDQNVLIFI